MFIRKYGDLLIGIYFMALAAAMFLMANALPPSLMGGLGSEFMPKVLAVGMGLLAAVEIVSGVKTMRAYREEAGSASQEDKPEYLRVFATILAFTTYVFVLNTVGFLISSVVYLFAQMAILAPREKRNYALFAVIAVVVSAAVYYIFRNGLSVMLPAGFLG